MKNGEIHSTQKPLLFNFHLLLKPVSVVCNTLLQKNEAKEKVSQKL